MRIIPLLSLFVLCHGVTGKIWLSKNDSPVNETVKFDNDLITTQGFALKINISNPRGNQAAGNDDVGKIKVSVLKKTFVIDVNKEIVRETKPLCFKHEEYANLTQLVITASKTDIINDKIVKFELIKFDCSKENQEDIAESKLSDAEIAGIVVGILLLIIISCLILFLCIYKKYIQKPKPEKHIEMQDNAQKENLIHPIPTEEATDSQVITPEDQRKLILEKISKQDDFKEELQEYKNLTSINSSWTTEDDTKMTLLHYAVQERNEKGVKTLLEQDADPNTKVHEGEGGTLLHLAAKLGSSAITELLLNKGAKVDQHNNLKNTPLGEAARYGKLDVAQLLLKNKANVNHQMGSGWTPLHAAVQCTQNKEDMEVMVRLLLENKADPTLRASSRSIDPTMKKMTPIEIAKIKSLNIFIDQLHYAVQEKNEELVKILLEQGIDPNTATQEGEFPLHLAAKLGSSTITALLLNSGAKVNQHNNYKNTPLHVASRFGNIEVARMLLENHANVNSQMNSGWTPLHAAVTNNDKDMVRLLLESKADPTLKASSKKIDPTMKKMTPLELARKQGFTEIGDILQVKMDE